MAYNLRMSLALGLITCLRYSYHCIICYQAYDDESCFIFRTREEYEKNLWALKKLGRSETMYGVLLDNII